MESLHGLGCAGIVSLPTKGLSSLADSGKERLALTMKARRSARVAAVFWLTFIAETTCARGAPRWVEPTPRTSLLDVRVRFSVPDRPYVVLRRGPLEAVVVDNRAVDDDVLPGHRSGYHGLGSLKHEHQRRNLFVPSYAGLNFEHIHDGTVQDSKILFEPRQAPMQLRVIDDHTAELYQAPTPHWGLESCLRYQLLEGGAIEVTFECVPRRDAFKNGYIGLFWASYVHRPESLDIHFLGCPADDRKGAPGWIRGVTPAHGELPTHLALYDQREFARDEAFPLKLVFNRSRYRYAEPWYFGVCRGMAFAQTFRASDQVRLSQSPSGGGAGNPAWDFQWFIPDYQVDRSYQLVMRALYHPITNGDDVSATRETVRAAVAPLLNVAASVQPNSPPTPDPVKTSQSLNPPTPNPSQQGTKHPSAPQQFPSREGLAKTARACGPPPIGRAGGERW